MAAEIYFNIWDPEFRANPYPHYSPLLASTPPILNMVPMTFALVARFAAVSAALRRHEHLSIDGPPSPPLEYLELFAVTDTYPVAIPPQAPETIRAIYELGYYFTDEIEKRRSNPGPDLVSALVAAHDEGDVMSAADLLSFVTLLLVAGNETTTNLIGNGTLALGRHPDQFDALKRDPSMLPRAIEDMLRYTLPLQSTVRFTKEPLQLGGTEIPAGAFALMIVAAANRDPAQFRDPEKFDIARDP